MTDPEELHIVHGLNITNVFTGKCKLLLINLHGLNLCIYIIMCLFLQVHKVLAFSTPLNTHSTMQNCYSLDLEVYSFKTDTSLICLQIGRLNPNVKSMEGQI